MRLHRIGERPAQTVLVTFDKTKVTRARSVRKLLILPWQLRLLLSKTTNSKGHCKSFRLKASYFL